jgi:hypothetical protein
LKGHAHAQLFPLLLTCIAQADRVGIGAMRIAIAIVFLWIGALKFVPYEADSISRSSPTAGDVILLQASDRISRAPDARGRAQARGAGMAAGKLGCTSRVGHAPSVSTALHCGDFSAPFVR